MKALVLTYDRQIGLADLVVRSYDRLLADQVFEFRVPINAQRERGNIVKMDEPLDGGQLTRNGVEALRQYGCQVPDYPVRNVSIGFRDCERQLAANPHYLSDAEL